MIAQRPLSSPTLVIAVIGDDVLFTIDYPVVLDFIYRTDWCTALAVIAQLGDNRKQCGSK